MDLFRQHRLDLRKHLIDQVFRAHHRRIDSSDDLLQEGHIALLLAHDQFPVPLIHIEGVEIAQLLIRANRVHIGIDTVTLLDLVISQCQSFPFRQRVYDLRFCVTQILDWERNSPFRTIQVIVNTHSLEHEKWGRDTP